VLLGRSRIHLSQLAQRTRYASNWPTYGSARRYSMRSSSVRFARRRFGGWGPEEADGMFDPDAWSAEDRCVESGSVDGA
jgi:hypothetical protein